MVSQAYTHTWNAHLASTEVEGKVSALKDFARERVEVLSLGRNVVVLPFGRKDGKELAQFLEVVPVRDVLPIIVREETRGLVQSRVNYLVAEDGGWNGGFHLLLVQNAWTIGRQRFLSTCA